MLASRLHRNAALRQSWPRTAIHHGTRSWPMAATDDAAAVNALQVTDPLAIYRAKVLRGELEEDEEQVKALVKLRNLNRRLQDYTPPAHLLGILRHVEGASGKDASDQNKRQVITDSQTELIKYLSAQETLADLDTPQGLLLTGPPGTGKSMVLDIWFDSLPIRGKFRRHYHHLLLTLYRIIWLEGERRRQALRGGAPPAPLATSDKDLEWGRHASSGPRRSTVMPERGTGVVWKRGGPEGKGSGWRRVLQGMPFFRPDSLSEGSEMTADERMAQEATTNLATASQTTLPLHAASQLFLNYGPVMLFDEVQLVDVASAGLLKRTLEAYWLLGGVVVGSSNRLPEDLYNNGVQQQQLIQFFEALRSRCPVHEMHGERDFRRMPGALNFWNQLAAEEKSAQEYEQGKVKNSQAAEAAESQGTTIGNTTYFVHGQEAAFESKLNKLIDGRAPTPTTLSVYNRPVTIPIAYAPTSDLPSIGIFNFAQLCDSPLGPADYLTIVSHFEEIVVRDVPQLLLANKNQARRWITFIDAAYESGSRLLIYAASSPDDLFFPDARGERTRPRGSVGPSRATTAEPDDVVDMSARGAPSPFRTPPPGEAYPEEEELLSRRRGAGASQDEAEDWNREELFSDQLIQSETLSEARQDVEEGFRPNISSYVDVSDTRRSPGASVLEARRAEVEARRLERERRREKEETVVGFPDLAIFSGADERFSYARAVSRLHEMANPIWRRRKQWSPLLESELRLWGVKDHATVEESTTVERDSSTGALRETRTTTTTTHPSREAHPTLAAMDDFADEASYEDSTFPSRTSEYSTVDKQRDPFDTSRSGPVAYNLPSTSRFNRQHQNQQERASAEELQAEEERRRASRTSDSSSESSGWARDGPPKISPVHVWGQAQWGPKAGKWGQGPSALATEEGKGDVDVDVEAETEESLRDRRARLRKLREEEREMRVKGMREGAGGK